MGRCAQAIMSLDGYVAKQGGAGSRNGHVMRGCGPQRGRPESISHAASCGARGPSMPSRWCS